MSDKIDDGGPASEKSLRDEFAGKVMTGLLSNPGGPVQVRPDTGWGWCNFTGEQLAAFAFGLADAMLAARRREGGAE